MGLFFKWMSVKVPGVCEIDFFLDMFLLDLGLHILCSFYQLLLVV